MRVRVYFCNESDIQSDILRNNKISRQALDTVYNLVWEYEFKNILNAGRIWLKFINEKNPFGVPLRKKRTHNKIAAGDIMQWLMIFMWFMTLAPGKYKYVINCSKKFTNENKNTLLKEPISIVAFLMTMFFTNFGTS